ncbi:thioredoxin domain-containing protein 3 [Copidosoma floridanum]|uniref:thioredoxin domain-containing protein 3 n=1 Tax=Copidosoma floridanum TaxID=29053 RepID=UPI0006C96596|nr:thioredoxin domain-containing protein 3 [Copidosoma floridanum]
MTKKGGAAALQTDVANDEDWNKILERPGLVLVDVYCEWSGPCTGMVSILKKIKMEIGGDDLSYATARCDEISSLVRFRGKSEPAWMFIRDGMMINIVFGANCPQLTETLTKELKRLQNNEPPELSIPVSEICEMEAERTRIFLEAKRAREAEALAKIEAKATAKYEARLEHYVTSLSRETLLIFFPWIFKDEEGNLRDKKASPAYVELTDQLLPGNFVVEQEVKKHMSEEDVVELQKETDFDLCELTKHLLTDGTCLCMRLKMSSRTMLEEELDANLCDLLFNEPRVPLSPDAMIDDCFVHRHMTNMQDFNREGESVTSEAAENLMTLTVLWVPINQRNRAIVFKHIFSKYVDSTYPLEEADEDIPITVFKYDSTKKKELKVVLNTYANDVISFGIFERDSLPNPKFITKLMERFEHEYKDKTGYEVFVVVIKKENPEAFLSFAGIGPYHVSENPEVAIEEAEQYFPKDALEDDLPSEDEDGQGEFEYEGYEGDGFSEMGDKVPEQ